MGPTRYQLVVFVCFSISVLMLLSSLLFIISRAHSGSPDSFHLLQYISIDVSVESVFRPWSGPLGFNRLFSFFQYFSVDVTIESIFRHWYGPLVFNWRLSFAPQVQCCCDCRVYFPSLVGFIWQFSFAPVFQC